MTQTLRDRLYPISPYEGLDPADWPDDLQGWGSDHPVLATVIEQVRPKRIVEVGSWKGRSAINMARTVRALGLDCEIICVDTWLGSPEHWLSEGGNWQESLALRHGYPQLYYTFLGNVVRHGFQDIITPLPMTSESAAFVLQSLGMTFDIAYIDAAHEYGPAKRDFVAYYDLLNDTGVLIGDDYIYWPGVTQAANEFALERGLRIVGEPGKFVISKNADLAPGISIPLMSRLLGKLRPTAAA
jgi:SAM-dependent methyltransferase